MPTQTFKYELKIKAKTPGVVTDAAKKWHIPLDGDPYRNAGDSSGIMRVKTDKVSVYDLYGWHSSAPAQYNFGSYEPGTLLDYTALPLPVPVVPADA